MNSGENQCFLIKWFLENQRVRVPCHGSDKGWCIVRIDRARVFGEFFWTGFGDLVVTMVVEVFCTAWFSLCSATQVDKKSGDAVAFLNVAPVWLHCQNREQLSVGVNIWESNVWFCGDWRFDFFSDGEKRAERCGSKMDECKVGVNQKYVPYTYKKFTYCSTYQCTPYFKPNIGIISQISPKWGRIFENVPYQSCRRYVFVFGTFLLYWYINANQNMNFWC